MSEKPRNFGEYLQAVQEVYNAIKRQGDDIYVSRNHWMRADLSLAFTLPSQGRITNSEGNLVLSPEDSELIWDRLGPWRKFFSNGRDLSLTMFGGPNSDETLSLENMEELELLGITCLHYAHSD